MKTALSEFTILKQICELVPAHLVTHLARKYGVEDKCRTRVLRDSQKIQEDYQGD